MAYDSLTLNGNYYNRKDLLEYAHNKLRNGSAEWEQQLFDFIIHWLDSEPYIIAHTSGSTGQPKEVRLGKQQMINSAQMTINYLGLQQGDTALLSLPVSYIAGKMMVVRALVGKLNLLTTEPANNPLEAVDSTISIDFTAWVPMQMQTAMEFAPQHVNAIKTIILGGSPVSKELESIIKGLNNDVYETFGMTETISHIAMRQLTGRNAQDDFETTDERFILGQDDRDCLVIIAPGITNSPVVTNDIVDIKDDRHFRWIGRVDNVVNSGGIKLHPELLEEKLSGLIAERFFLAGVDDAELGQKLVLVLETMEQNGQKDELMAKIKQHLKNRYEVPRAIYFADTFEETGSGKIARNETLRLLGLIQ